MRRVLGIALMSCGSEISCMVLDEYPIMKSGNVCGCFELSVLKTRRGEDDVIDLPLTGRARSVGQRRTLSIQRSSPSIGVGPVVIAVQHLKLVSVHQEDAAVPPLLAVAF